MRTRYFPFWLCFLFTIILLSACGGGGGGSSSNNNTGNAAALVVAEKVSVVDAQPSGTAAVKPLLMGVSKVKAANLPSNSDYNTDATQVWVSERSTEAFNTVNDILCMMAQTKYDSMLNKGAYIAQVDSNQCSSDRSDAASAGQESQNQSSGSNMPKYEMFTVESSRSDDNSPEIIKVWVHEDAGESDPAKVIFGKAVITEGKSATNPYGIFTMDFKASPVVNGVVNASVTMFKGTLKAERDATGKVLLKFVEDGGDGSNHHSGAVTLDRAADGSSGSGTVWQKETHTESGNPVTNENKFDIAFNTANFFRKDATSSPTLPDVCLNRSAFEESAWRYGLYDANGARVNRNSGFSINTNADGSGAHGWIGYWGMWMDNNTTLTNGQTVYKYDHNSGNSTATPYTVFVAGGKLKKHTRKSLVLGDIKNIPLDGYMESDPQNPNGWINYQVKWDGLQLKFFKIASMPQNCTNNCSWSNLPSPVAIDPAHLQWSELNFWSQSLGGQVRVPLGSAASPCTYVPGTPGYTDCSNNLPTNDTPVIFYAEDIVYPGDSTVPASFSCFDNCPNATAAGIDTANPFLPFNQSTPHTYTFDANAMLLKYNEYAAVQTAPINGQNWGIMSGALFDPNTPNLNTILACDWDPNQICGWKAWSALDVFYTWETGLNNWNQFTGLKDSNGNFLRFEAPLSVKYVHRETGSPYDGATFMLDYSGFGNLWGIPGKCVDMDSGQEVDCSTGGPGSPVRWVPAFTIPEAQASGDLTTVELDAATKYFVKPLEKEQRMKAEAVSACDSLTPTSYTLPDLSTWTDPNIGTEPAVTDPPAVIGGIVQ